MGKGTAMGKKPVLGMIGCFWMGLALSGCECCQNRSSGQKFQPAPFMQTKAPAANQDVAATGFQSTPKNLTASPAAQPATTADAGSSTSSALMTNNTPAATEPAATRQPAAMRIQPAGGTLAGLDSSSPIPPIPPSNLPRNSDDSGSLNTMRKSAPNDLLPPAPQPTMAIPPAIPTLPAPPNMLLPVPGTSSGSTTQSRSSVPVTIPVSSAGSNDSLLPSPPSVPTMLPIGSPAALPSVPGSR